MTWHVPVFGDFIGVVGSRRFANYALVRQFVNSLPDGTTLVSGGASGVDTAAELAAKLRKLPTKIIHADWASGKDAGFRRNTEIVEESQEVHAFWDGQSRGTADTIEKCKSWGVTVYVYNEKGEVIDECPF